MEYYFAGSFSPPTKGHANLLNKVRTMYVNYRHRDSINIICSGGNPDKDNWFSEEESVSIWNDIVKQPLYKQDALYVDTYSYIKQAFQNNPDRFKKAVLLKGIRDASDLKDTFMIEANKKLFGIEACLSVYADSKDNYISSSAARAAFEKYDFQKLKECVHPVTIRKMFQKRKGFLPIVVSGLPATGKSTIIKKVIGNNSNYHYIDTDVYNKKLRHLLPSIMGPEEIIEACLHDTPFILNLQQFAWFDLLAEDLKAVPEGTEVVFIEIPQSFRQGYNTFEYLSDVCIDFTVDPSDLNVLKERVLQRNKNQEYLLEFIDTPVESRLTVIKHNLKFLSINAVDSIDSNVKKLEHFITHFDRLHLTKDA